MKTLLLMNQPVITINARITKRHMIFTTVDKLESNCRIILNSSSKMESENNTKSLNLGFLMAKNTHPFISQIMVKSKSSMTKTSVIIRTTLHNHPKIHQMGKISPKSYIVVNPITQKEVKINLKEEKNGIVCLRLLIQSRLLIMQLKIFEFRTVSINLQWLRR